MFGIINVLGALQENGLKNHHHLKVPLTSSYIIELQRKDSDKPSLDFSGWYVVAMGWNKYEYFSPSLILTILCDYTIQMVSRILVHQILIYPKEHGSSSHEVDIREVSCLRLEGGVYGLDAGA